LHLHGCSKDKHIEIISNTCITDKSILPTYSIASFAIVAIGKISIAVTAGSILHHFLNNTLVVVASRQQEHHESET
jgi:hypothetical protein